jgi:uncharacterized protein (DUF433 family)
MLSFMQLVEVVVVARFRQIAHPVKLETVREARRKVQELWGIEYPFASVKMATLPLPELVQYEFDHRIAFDGDQWAVRWYPLGQEKPFVVDPHIAGGRPTIVNRGVTVETLTLRWKNGESIRMIARDYELDEDHLEEVFRLMAVTRRRQAGGGQSAHAF